MSIKNLEVLEKTLKIEAGTLQKAIDNDESVDVEIQELIIRTKEEDETNETNLRADLKDEFQAAGLGVAIKTARTEHNLEFEGKKDLNNLLTAFKTKVLKEAEVEPTKRITELETDLTTVRQNLTDSEQKFTDLTLSVEKGKSQAGINNSIMDAIKGETTISKPQILTLFNSDFSTSLNDDGKIEIKKNGEVLKNESDRSLKSIEDVMSEFSKPFAKKAEGGRGGDDDPGNAKEGSVAAFTKEMKEKGHNPSSETFQREMQKRIKDGTLKQ